MKKFKISATITSTYTEEVEFIVEAESQKEAEEKFKAQSNKFDFENETTNSWHGDDHKLTGDDEEGDFEISEVAYISVSRWRYMLLGDTKSRMTHNKYASFDNALHDLGITAPCVESYSIVEGTQELIAEDVA